MRVPILLWGDVVSGEKAITRRTLVGERAHECMYAWVYLTDFLSIKRLTQKGDALKKIANFKFFKDFDSSAWNTLNRKEIDPHFQIISKQFETAGFMGGILRGLNNKEKATVAELGQTFFTFIDKFRFLEKLSNEPLDSEQINWVGIDNSEFANITASTLHINHKNISFYNDWKDFKTNGNAIFHSRFVCSYAFPTTNAFADFISSNFSACVIEDAFSIVGKEVEVFNHGQRQLFFSLNDCVNKLRSQGFKVFLIDWYGDFPAGSEKCFVTKLLVFKESAVDLAAVCQHLSNHGLNFDPLKADIPDMLNYMDTRIDSKEWAKIKDNKLVNPVWSRTVVKETNLSEDFKNIARKIRNKFRIVKNGFHRHDLRGQNMDESILIYLDEKNK